MADFSSIRRLVPALAMIALVGFSSQIRAEEKCPELTRLRSEVDETAKRSLGASSAERCEAYVRISIAWGQATEYAKDHRDSCRIGAEALSNLEKQHRDSVQERDNICAGRPGRPYRSDTIVR
jgi:hypothetical protein